ATSPRIRHGPSIGNASTSRHKKEVSDLKGSLQIVDMIDLVVTKKGKISFNMQGIINIDEMLSGAQTYAGQSVTADELRYVCGNAAARAITTFYNGDAPC
ncbi:hypothetical protein, partial [Streptomyces sp. NPDC088350]|uniref:hypothetical protein n=1 Tax=Streptomyces sp. NPDC088350 TaxID=3365854 RepID=UPI0037F34163